MTKEIIEKRIRLNGLQVEEETTERLKTYLDLLMEWNQRMDLTAVLEEDEMLDRHFIDSLTVLKTGWLDETRTLIDVGTGAGFPGMVLALARPELSVTLLDAQQKRLSFLKTVVEAVGARNVTLIHGRAEESGHLGTMREQFDIAAARAVAPLDVLSEYLLPFVRTGGKMICWKGPALRDELESGRRAVHLLGGRLEMPVACPVVGREWDHWLQPAVKVQPTPRIYPRRAGLPKSKPLGRS